MALKPSRQILADGTFIEAFMNETASRGEVVVWSTSGSGASLDDPNAVVTSPSTISGSKPAGVLLNDVVNLDLTRQHLNHHKDEVQQGGKVTLVRKGIIETNNILSTDSPSAGDPAFYVAEDGIGKLTTSPPTDDRWETGRDVDALYRVGTFLSKKDSDGYAKVQISL